MKTLKMITLATMLGIAGVAFAATPDLTVRVVGQSNVAAGANQKVATVVLTAGAQDVTVKSVPVTVNGNVSNCTLRDNTGAMLDGYSFAQPIRVPAGAVLDIAYTCTVGASANATISLIPGSIVATTNSGAASVGGVPTADQTVTIGSGGSSSTPGVPNTGSGGSTGDTTTPGVPNTGAGGDAAVTWFMLALSALVAIASATYVARMRRA